MRTQTIVYYSFNELSDQGKEKAIENYRASKTEYNWTYEWVDSLKAFCNVLDINLTSYELSPYSHCDVSWFFEGDIQIEELKGVRLATWLINNWLQHLGRGKYYSSPGEYVNGRYKYKFRHSKIIMDYQSCALTGVCSDQALIDPILDFIKKPDITVNLNDLINECFYNYTKLFQSDMEYQDSDEYIIEDIEANNYEFTENGGIV